MDGKVRGFVAMVQDITERKRTEAELRRSEEQFRKVFHESPLGMALLAQGFRYIQANSVLCRMLGYSEAELLKRTAIDVTHPEDQELGVPEAEQLLRGKRYGGVDVEKRYVTSAGEIVWVRVHSSLLRDADSQPWRNLVLVEDITERRKSEAALRERQATISALLESASRGILCVDGRGRIVVANAMAERLFDYSREELLDRALEELLPDRVRERHAGYFANYLAAPHTRPMGIGLDLTARTRDGTEFPVEISLSSIETQNGVLAVAFITDTTSRKQAEAALQAQAKELARSNAELQEFAYAISHDLQEPLRAISSYSKLLAQPYKEKLDSDADKFLGYVTDGAQRMSVLIRDLLNYSRVSSPETARTELVDLNEVMRLVLMNLELPINDSEAEMIVPPLPTLYGQRVPLVQLFQNLLGNALKYRNPEHPPRIEIRVERSDDLWCFSVEDNGIGIDPQHHERIFGIFKRLHGAQYPGTGLGLALCRKIVEHHGGRIWVKSTVGHGATFRFTLPVSSNTRRNVP